ncbi:stage III sporulation protein SpoIIIAB [Marinicrinis sediminis]|uniref:Stage III sporulation protein SpoIIIAB n=1 Tax=Marinicrinis sediminis TaxID=1652465 RepID=A0ABW5RDT9_9BACL
MLHILGSLLILGACTMAGFYQAAIIAKRPRQIRELMLHIQRLETEINYGMTPMPEAIQRIVQTSKPPVGDIFKAISDSLSSPDCPSLKTAWERGVRQVWGVTTMRLPEREAFERLGQTLGISHRADQMKYLQLAIQQLAAEEDLARAEQQKYEKMWKSLGVLTGILLVILFV